MLNHNHDTAEQAKVNLMRIEFALDPIVMADSLRG